MRGYEKDLTHLQPVLLFKDSSHIDLQHLGYPLPLPHVNRFDISQNGW
jgi:hypothetical protein